MDTWQHPLEQPEPTNEFPPPLLPEAVLEKIQQLEPPFIIYYLPQVRKSVKGVIEAFSHYRYPLKCNSFKPVIDSVIEEGAGLDVCSEGELKIALKTKVPKHLISYTGMAISKRLMSRLMKLGVTVNLDSIQEIEQWIKLNRNKTFGIRVKSGNDERYLAKFGVRPIEFRELSSKSKQKNLLGLHTHYAHKICNVENIAGDYLSFSNDVIDILDGNLSNLHYINLGGGWPVDYSGVNSFNPTQLSSSLNLGPLKLLYDNGFSGNVIVEPGEFIIADCGYWGAQVIVIKGGTEKYNVAILGTSTPIPSASLPYPVIVLRKKDRKYNLVKEERKHIYRLVGATNSPFDTIRKRILLPKLRQGDIVVMCRSGAYLNSLIGNFNKKRPPREYAVDTK